MSTGLTYVIDCFVQSATRFVHAVSEELYNDTGKARIRRFMKRNLQEVREYSE